MNLCQISNALRTPSNKGSRIPLGSYTNQNALADYMNKNANKKNDRYFSAGNPGANYNTNNGNDDEYTTVLFCGIDLRNIWQNPANNIGKFHDVKVVMVPLNHFMKKSATGRQ